MKLLLQTQPVRQQLKVVRNEQGWPGQYSCNFLEPGVVSYRDVGQGVAYLRKETIDSWVNSFVGKPVVIDHSEVTPENFKDKAVGYITKVWYNAGDGWYWADFLLTDDEAKKLVEKGYSVSCAFDVEDTLPGGEAHAVKYDEEITKGTAEHLAIVETPRYEGCRIVQQGAQLVWNSKKAKVIVNKVKAENKAKYHVTVNVDGSPHGFGNIQAEDKSEAEKLALQKAKGTIKGDDFDVAAVEIQDSKQNKDLIYAMKLVEVMRAKDKSDDDIRNVLKASGLNSDEVESVIGKVPNKEDSKPKEEVEKMADKKVNVTLEDSISDSAGNEYKIADLLQCYNEMHPSPSVNQKEPARHPGKLMDDKKNDEEEEKEKKEVDDKKKNVEKQEEEEGKEGDKKGNTVIEVAKTELPKEDKKKNEEEEKKEKPEFDKKNDGKTCEKCGEDLKECTCKNDDKKKNDDEEEEKEKPEADKKKGNTVIETAETEHPKSDDKKNDDKDEEEEEPVKKADKKKKDDDADEEKADPDKGADGEGQTIKKVNRNVDYFVKLNSMKKENMVSEAEEAAFSIDTLTSRLNRGKDRYGTPKSH